MKNVPVFFPVFLYAVTLLIFQIKRIISREKWFNYVATFFFFFLKIPKIWVGRKTLYGEKEKDGLNFAKLYRYDVMKTISKAR